MSTDGRSAGFELVDHTSEVTLRLHAPSFAGVVVQATLAFLSLVPEASRGPVEERGDDLELDASDRAATLVEWLNELVFRGEAEGWLPVEPTVEAVGDSGIRVRAKRLELSEPFVLVKAATLHGAAVRESERGLEAEVTLDI